MNPKAYSPIWGCLIIATSLKAPELWSDKKKEEKKNINIQDRLKVNKLAILRI